MKGVMDNFWETTYKQNIAKMIGVCWRYTHDRQTAEDLAHDAFLVAINKSASFENRGPFEAWLRRIVVNVALQYLRDQKKQQQHDDIIAYRLITIEPQDEPYSNETNAFSEAELLEAINLLPEHHRLVFNLHVFDNFTHAQIGAELGISEGTSKSHLARARKKIKEILTTKLKENKKRNSVFLLFSLPYKRWNLDNFYKNRLSYFEIQPQKIVPINFKNFPIPQQKPPAFLSKMIIKTVASVMSTSVLLLYFNSYKEYKSPVLTNSSDSITGNFYQVHPKNTGIKKFSTTDARAATFSTKGIISTENTKNNEKMKPLNSLGALLITSSALFIDTTSLLKKEPLLPMFKNQEIMENNVAESTELTQRNKTSLKGDSVDVFGTFYASKIFWSAANNEVYFKGEHVKVNVNSNKFNGSGTFSFLNKINYLFIDGTPMKLNETVELTEKKYNLSKLTQKAAVKKYGDKGKLGVVEITLAE